MTIEIKVTSVADVSADNQVLNFSRANAPKNHILAAANWLTTGLSPYDSLISVLRIVYGLVLKNLPEHKVWFLIENSGWQPDTRIVRYRKLWGALKVRGIEISHSGTLQETMVEAGGKLKFFGATQFSELSIGSVAKALLDEHCAYIAALPKNYDIQEVIGMGWTGGFDDDVNFLCALNKKDGLIFKRAGEFDDHERGLVAVGSPELLSKLLS